MPNKNIKPKCKICKEEFSTYRGLGIHVAHTHKISTKDYYDKYIKESESEGFCRTCGKPTTFVSINNGYRPFCCSKCVNSNSEVQDKIKATMLEKYGVENVSQSDIIKRKKEQTSLKNYGVKYPAQTKEIQNKMKATMLKRYGVENASQSDIIKKKKEETSLKNYGATCFLKTKEGKDNYKKAILKKYGVENISQLNSIKKKKEETTFKNYGVKNPFSSKKIINKIKNKKYKNNKFMEGCGYLSKQNIEKLYGTGWYQAGILENELVTYKYDSYLHVRYIYKIIEYNKDSKVSSNFEKDVRKFVYSICKEDILFNDRQAIKPLELDIYIPEEKLAIECNGIYWHSIEKIHNPNYHLKKTQACEKEGIRLIHITDWEWKNKKEICKSIIASAFGIYKNTIDSKDCIVKKLNISTAKQFLLNNDIQNVETGETNLGLYYKNSLVQIITLSKKENEYELIRMCTKLNTKIINGFSKLMENLPKEITKVITYVDREKSNQDIYYKNNWKYIHNTKPSYFYYCKTEDSYTRDKEYRNNTDYYLKNYNCGYAKLEWTKDSF